MWKQKSILLQQASVLPATKVPFCSIEKPAGTGEPFVLDTIAYTCPDMTEVQCPAGFRTDVKEDQVVGCLWSGVGSTPTFIPEPICQPSVQQTIFEKCLPNEVRTEICEVGSCTLEESGIQTRLQTALKMESIAEPYIKRRAVRHLEKKRVVIFSAGTGNPFFTTDSAAVLRAIEINADVILKGTRVDGIYNLDPEKNKDAIKFEHLTFDDAITKKLKVMDSTAFTLSKENNLPIIVFNMNKPGNLKKIIDGKQIGTIVN